MKKLVLLSMFFIAIVGCQSGNELTILEESVNIKGGGYEDDVIAKRAVDFINDIRPQTRNSGSLEITSVYPWLRSDVGSTRSTSGYDTDTLLYIVNFSNNQGYALVSADEVFDYPVIAFVDEGELTPDSVVTTPGFRQFLDTYFSRLEDLEFELNPPLPYYPIIGEFWTIDTLYTPLLSTKWGQNSPFNTYCYSPNGELSVAGCVAIALGQIFSKHRYPLSYGGHTYAWSDILLGSVPTSDAGKESVANLVHDIGLLVRMSYSPEGSGASFYDVPYCLDAYGYNHYEIEYSYNFDLCARSVHYGCPVYMSGTRWDPVRQDYSGHAWVIDGILVRHQIEQQLPSGESIPWDVHRYVHCNWGWSGKANGYFLSGVFNVMERELDDNMNPAQNNYSLDRNYQYYLKMIHGISRFSPYPIQ